MSANDKRMKFAAALLISLATLSAQTGLIEGRANSPVRVVIYEDLQCPDCAVFRQMLDEKLLPRYAAKVAFVHRDFPLAKHAWAMPAAIASRYLQTISTATAAEFRRETMRAQSDIKGDTFRDWLKAFCDKRGLDAAKALSALDDAALRAAVQKDFDDGAARGVAHTPTALVNGVPFIETFTFEEISKGIDAALKENGIE